MRRCPDDRASRAFHADRSGTASFPRVMRKATGATIISTAPPSSGWPRASEHRAQSVHQPHHRRRRRSGQHSVRLCSDGRGGHQPGHEPRHRLSRIHRRRPHRGADAVTAGRMDRRARGLPLGQTRNRGRRGDPVRPRRRIRFRTGHGHQQSDRPDRLHQRPVPVAQPLNGSWVEAIGSTRNSQRCKKIDAPTAGGSVAARTSRSVAQQLLG